MPDMQSVRPDQLRAALARLSIRLDDVERATAASTASSLTLTDNVPRWVAIPVSRTLFTPTAATTVDVTVTSFPPGTIWTAERIDVATTFVSVGGTWRMTVKVPTGGTSVGGTSKAPDITTPDALAQRCADEIVMSDPSGACDVVINIDSAFTDTADQLTQGAATVNLLVSNPGSTSDDLPHS